MAKRRGFFAEMQHQAQVAARENERAQRQYAQAHARAVRDAERAQAAAERAAVQAARATEQERKRLERDAKLAHEAAMQADVDERNAGLEATYAEIDRMLAATLDVDDHVDLEDLRRVSNTRHLIARTSSYPRRHQNQFPIRQSQHSLSRSRRRV